MAEEITALAEGYITGASINVTPKDVQPGGTIHIRAVFENASWWPACGVLEIVLDGAVIDSVGDIIPYCSITDKTYVYEEDYTLPNSISSGMTHSVEAREAGQTTVTAIDSFTVTSPAPPGQRNVSFTSIPAGAQIYVSEGYIGNSPITIPLAAGTYAVRAVYTGQEVSRNISVTTGAGTIGVEFTFTQETPFDLGKWAKDNQWYIIGGAAGIALLALAIKKPDTVKRGYDKTKEYAGKAYEKAKEVYQKSMEKE